jgi:hypothetical protein
MKNYVELRIMMEEEHIAVSREKYLELQREWETLETTIQALKEKDAKLYVDDLVRHARLDEQLTALEQEINDTEKQHKGFRKDIGGVKVIEFEYEKDIYAEGTKQDNGKTDWTILPFAALEEVVKVLEYGAKKYSRDNWKKVTPENRYIKAAFRHLIAYVKGEEIDNESGLNHLAHCVASLLIYMEKRGIK